MMATCPVCSKAMLSEQPHVHAPSRPEPFEPRDAEPMTVLMDVISGKIDKAEYERRMAALERRFSGQVKPEPTPDRRSCLSVLGFLVLFWAAVLRIAGWWTL
jgi:hypothetical protein